MERLVMTPILSTCFISGRAKMLQEPAASIRDSIILLMITNPNQWTDHWLFGIAEDCK